MTFHKLDRFDRVIGMKNYADDERARLLRGSNNRLGRRTNISSSASRAEEDPRHSSCDVILSILPPFRRSTLDHSTISRSVLRDDKTLSCPSSRLSE